MPRMDGLTTCKRLRALGATMPVLMLTARDMVGDRVTGLDVSADDYLAKPFELDELLARIRALLRRTAMNAAADADADASAGVCWPSTTCAWTPSPARPPAGSPSS